MPGDTPRRKGVRMKRLTRGLRPAGAGIIRIRRRPCLFLYVVGYAAALRLRGWLQPAELRAAPVPGGADAPYRKAWLPGYLRRKLVGRL